MSLRAAINAKCKDCIYDPCAPGNWRQQTAACRITSCSLHPYRPLSRPGAKVHCDSETTPFETLSEASEVSV